MNTRREISFCKINIMRNLAHRVINMRVSAENITRNCKNKVLMSESSHYIRLISETRLALEEIGKNNRAHESDLKSFSA